MLSSGIAAAMYRIECAVLEHTYKYQVLLIEHNSKNHESSSGGASSEVRRKLFTQLFQLNLSLIVT